MSGGSLGRRHQHRPHDTSRSPDLPRHLAPGTAPRAAGRLRAARHTLRTRIAGRRSAIVLALGVACAAMLFAVPVLLIVGSGPDRAGRTGDDGVFSDETEGDTGGQGGLPGPATGAGATPSSGSPLPGDPAAAGGGTGADATGDLTGAGGNGARPGVAGTGTGGGAGAWGTGPGTTGTGTTGTTAGTGTTGTGSGGTAGGTSGGTSGGTGGTGGGTGGTGGSGGSGGTGGTGGGGSGGGGSGGGGSGGGGSNPPPPDDGGGDCVCEVIPTVPPLPVPPLPLDPDVGGTLDGVTGGLGL